MMPSAQNITPEKTPKKAIALLSGGLDSALAAKVMKELGIEVIGLHLLSPFGCREDVQKVADELGIPLHFKEKGEAYLDLVENPRYGYGKNMNPCIDCRIFMFQLADVVRQDLKADFIFTGEVLGQRPMSQNRSAIDLIESKSPLKGLVLRPLSAQNLPPTIPENLGWVDRTKLFSITGRGRKDQVRMAKEMKLSTYSAPGGGCLLTESAFSTRLKDFFENKTHTNSAERLAQSQMLRLGRHFRFSPSTKVIVSRNEAENTELEKLWVNAKGTLFAPKNFMGPSAVAFGSLSDSDKMEIGSLVARYGKAKDLSTKEITVSTPEDSDVLAVTDLISEERIETLRLGAL